MTQHDFEDDDAYLLADIIAAAAWDRAAAKALADFPQGGVEQMDAAKKIYIWELIVLGFIDTQGPTQ